MAKNKKICKLVLYITEDLNEGCTPEEIVESALDKIDQAFAYKITKEQEKMFDGDTDISDVDIEQFFNKL